MALVPLRDDTSFSESNLVHCTFCTGMAPLSGESAAYCPRRAPPPTTLTGGSWWSGQPGQGRQRGGRGSTEAMRAPRGHARRGGARAGADALCAW